MAILFLIGRILFGGYFFMMGCKHLFKTGMLAGYAASKGVPSAKLAVIVSGLLIFLGGAGVVLGIYPRLALKKIIVFLVLVTPKMHAYWSITDPMAKMGDQVNFQKNLALLGAALALLSFSATWSYSLLP